MRRLVFPAVVGVLVLAGGCAVKASANAKANTNGDVEGSVDTSGSSETSGPRPPPPAETTAPVASSGPPPPTGCAFRCYIADGPNRLPLVPEDEARITQTFASTMEGFRQCTGGRGFHRRGSPTINLRFNFQGELADEGHDLTDYFEDPAHACYEAVPKTTPKLSGPPASAVRCAESCVQKKPEKTPKNLGRTGRGGGRTAPRPPPVQSSDTPPPAPQGQ